ncbi:BTB/POZ and MATH domain-containing protein 2-like [Lolium perenne]|uniref:BTB/POZ and MATH domain-containing protein 2-like n=1 Tax=Lolium perenne TaxID=4522 RepID=UPI0021F58556|nr:BTB/POZ and MATH domain-containing protein 1-like [Lolium perenne]
MSMSTVMSALRGAGRQQLSASTFAVRHWTGSHVLRIHEFTQVRNMVYHGVEMRSSTFAVGGKDWRICCCPNGRYYPSEDYVSLYLDHDYGSNTRHQMTGDIMAKVQFSILDRALKPCYTQTTKLERVYGGLKWGACDDFIRHGDLDKAKHLNDDCLTILCDLTVAVTGTNDRMEVPSLPGPFDLQAGQLTEAIWNKERPDVRIEVDGEAFDAHRWVLEARSPVFKTDLSLAKATTGKAENTIELRIDDMDAEVFKALLQFIYTDAPPLLDAPTTAERLLVAADKYELEKLKLMCEEALCRHIGMGSVASTLALAERHRCPVLREACMRFLSCAGNLETIMAMQMDGFGELKRDCSSALLELVTKKMIEMEQ